MDKSLNGSIANSASSSASTKDSFKNAPHVAGQAMSEAKNSILEQTQPAVDFFKQNFSSVQDSAKQYYSATTGAVRNSPFYAILGAAAIGVGIGMWVSSRNSSES